MHLTVIEGMSDTEIAVSLHITAASVRSHRRRAKTSLNGILRCMQPQEVKSMKTRKMTTLTAGSRRPGRTGRQAAAEIACCRGRRSRGRHPSKRFRTPMGPATGSGGRAASRGRCGGALATVAKDSVTPTGRSRGDGPYGEGGGSHLARRANAALHDVPGARRRAGKRRKVMKRFAASWARLIWPLLLIPMSMGQTKPGDVVRTNFAVLIGFPSGSEGIIEVFC